MSDRPDETSPPAEELEGMLGQVSQCLIEYAQGNLDSTLDLKTENPWGEQLNAQFKQLRSTLYQLLIETHEQTHREQATRQMMARMQTATNLTDLLKVTAEALADYLNADVAFIELGLEPSEVATEKGNGQMAREAAA